MGKAMSALPELLQQSPFYEDGSDFFKALAEFVEEFFKIHESEWCDNDGHIKDKELLIFLEKGYTERKIIREERATKNARWLGLLRMAKEGKKWRCEGLKKMVKASLFGVTGWHRHVGTVADIMKDPELTSPSWVIGQRSAQPRQAMQASLIAATTLRKSKVGRKQLGLHVQRITA